MRFLYIYAIAVLLLVNEGFAFVQDPIPPSTRLNYFFDKDEDGRMDRLQIQFLGTISKEYIDEKLDSLTIDWADSAGRLLHIVVSKDEFILDTVSFRKIFIDLSEMQSRFLPMTDISSSEFFFFSCGTCVLFLSDGSSYNITLKDGMAPAAESYRLTIHRSSGVDSLKVVFTENVKPVASCDAYLEYKSFRDSVTRLLFATQVEWSLSYREAIFVLENNHSMDEHLTAGDSIRLVASCLKDSVGNAVSKNAKFGVVDGFFPFELYKQNLVKSHSDAAENSVFRLSFEDIDAQYPNDTSWGYAIDVLGPDFEASVREVLGMAPKDELLKSKIQILFDISIYTNLGSFVANAKYKVNGNDCRFEKTAKKLFLKWNLMDERKRRVSTGAYVSKFAVKILYDGKVVYRSDKDDSCMQVFGVLRR